MIEVLMIGPFPLKDDSRGISSVVSGYFKFGECGNYRMTYIATSRRGPFLSRMWGGISALVEYTSKLVLQNVQLVHIHTASKRSFYRKMMFGVIGKVFGARVIIHVHGGSFKEFYASSPPVMRRLFSRFLSWVDTIVVLTESWQVYFQSITACPRIRVLHNPVSGTEFRGIPERRERKSLTVLYMTMLYETKGVYVLLDAIPNVLREFPSAKILLCGDGDIERCREICKTRNILDNVEFCGWVRGETKMEKFGQADVFVLPSFHEGFPVAVIEAMFARLPIVCTPVGGIPDLLKDGENGFFVQPGSANELAEKICLLLANGELRERMGRHNHTQAMGMFDTGVVVEKLRKIYDELAMSAWTGETKQD